MVYTLLIPFDVFASVRHLDTIIQFTAFGQLRTLKIYDLYFLCYVCMIYLCFVGLPFSYFYAQTVQEQEEMEEYSSTPGIDSSESEEEQDIEISLPDSQDNSGPVNRKSKKQKHSGHLDQDEGAPKREKKGTFEQFWENSKLAMRKTLCSFICLAILMIISFLVSNYEYNQVHS